MVVKVIAVARYPFTVEVADENELDTFLDEFMFKGELESMSPFNYDTEDIYLVDEAYDTPEVIDYKVKGRSVKCAYGDYKVF